MDRRPFARAILCPAVIAASFLSPLSAACDKSSSAGAAAGDRRVTADEHGFSPSSLSLPKGAAGSKESISFLRTTDQTCATEVVFPELGLKKELPLNQPVSLDVPTDQARTLTFQCGMAMYKGALVVK